MINGVKIKQLKIHSDIPDLEQKDVRPGFLMEILRSDEEIFQKFGQSTMTVAYQGTIKGFHYHKIQTDMWFIATGKAMIVLHDMRPDSPTYKQTDTFLAGEGDYKLVSIPTGVAHGYKVLSDEPVILFYHVTEPYNKDNPDEQVIPHNDASIGFDWTKV